MRYGYGLHILRVVSEEGESHEPGMWKYDLKIIPGKTVRFKPGFVLA
jgi:hypothetical protein